MAEEKGMKYVSFCESQDLENIDPAPFKIKKKKIFRDWAGGCQLRKTPAIINLLSATQKIHLYMKPENKVPLEFGFPLPQSHFSGP